MSQFDYTSLHQFLTQTPEQGLRKMLVDNKPMTDVHFGLLIKIVRNCDEKTFVSHCEKQDFPKIKMGPAEQKLKDKFWAACFDTLKSRGILQPLVAAKAA